MTQFLARTIVLSEKAVTTWIIDEIILMNPITRFGWTSGAIIADLHKVHLW